MRPTRVLITGVSRYFGARIAGILQADPEYRAGHRRRHRAAADRPRPDRVRPGGHPQPVIGKVIATNEVDTVVHLNVIATPFSAGGRAAMKEINVIGTMQLLAACQKAPSMRKLAGEVDDRRLRLEPARPRAVHRGARAAALPRAGYAKDASRSRLRPRLRPPPARRDAVAAALHQLHRPDHRTPADALLSLPVGADRARLRPAAAMCHESDGIEVLRRDARGPPGIFNVGGTGVSASQAIRRRAAALSGAVARVDAVGRACSAGPASSDFSPSRCASSSTAGSPTTAGCATSGGYSPKYNLDRALRRLRARPRARPHLHALAGRGR
jgi:UDP-glucose 4-epimerase